MPIRIGLLGAGKAGERQAAGFAAHEGARIVGVADLYRTRADSLAQPYGAEVRTDVRDLLELGLDVLVVATPHAYHVEPAELAAARGVHVMMEKPLATRLADARRIVAASEEAGVILAVSFVHRFREEVKRAKAWLGDAGPLQVGRETMASRRLASDPGWLTDAAVAGGGVLMYSAIHGVDRLRWFWNDEVVEVSARARRWSDDEAGVEDGIAMLLTFAGGGAATLTANAPTYAVAAPVWETEVHGTRGMARVRTRGFAEAGTPSGTQRYDAGTDEETARPHYNFERQAADMLEALRSGRTPSVTGWDGLRALEVCLAAYRSAETGASVRIADLADG